MIACIRYGNILISFKVFLLNNLALTGYVVYTRQSEATFLYIMSSILVVKVKKKKKLNFRNIIKQLKGCNGQLCVDVRLIFVRE